MSGSTPNTEPDGSAPVEVAAGVIERNQQVLLSRRSASAHQGGKWEFPGGKLELGETPKEALARELREELGIEVVRSRPLIRILHRYDDRFVALSFFKVYAFDGMPRGLEGQRTAWFDVDALHKLDFPAADAPVLTALMLPDRCAITPPDLTVGELLASLTINCCKRGVVILRLPSLSAGDYEAVAAQAAPLARRRSCRLMLTGSFEQAMALGAAGVHLNSRRLLSLTQLPSSAQGLLVSAACHNAAELDHATRLGVDFVLLSPVCETRSHPGQTPLGWARFRQLAEPVPMPVYALGGVGLEDRRQAFEQGAQGVAGISRIYRLPG